MKTQLCEYGKLLKKATSLQLLKEGNDKNALVMKFLEKTKEALKQNEITKKEYEYLFYII